MDCGHGNPCRRNLLRVRVLFLPFVVKSLVRGPRSGTTVPSSPGERDWFFFPFFGALCLAWESTLRLWILLGNPIQARKYEAWSNMKTGFNATKVLRLMSIAIALPIGLATIMALPIHSSLGEAALTVGHFATPLPRHYLYSEIRTITVAEGIRTRDGGFQRRPQIVVDFADGSYWSSADNREPEKFIDKSLLDFLQTKKGLDLKYIDAFPFGTHLLHSINPKLRTG